MEGLGKSAGEAILGVCVVRGRRVLMDGEMGLDVDFARWRVRGSLERIMDCFGI